MDFHDGKCALCHSTGPSGKECATDTCAERNHYYLPLANYNTLPRSKSGGRDPYLGQRIGDYLVAGVVGKGAFGKVYLSLELPSLKETALKLMTLDPDGAGLERFQREAEILAKVNHPNIVSFEHYGTHHSFPYIVMEYIPGSRNLRTEMLGRMQFGMPLESDVVRHIIQQVLSALYAAHRVKIVHRDIKPENIMLTTVGDDRYVVRILDFGLAKFILDGTRTVTVAGTPTYMAPEQIRRRHIGPWCDLFSAAVITVELLVGCRLYYDETVELILKHKLDPKYDPFGELPDLELPAEMMAFFRKALAWKVEERYQSAGEFLEAMNSAFDVLDAVRSGARPLKTASQQSAEEESKRLAQERKSLDSFRKELASGNFATLEERLVADPSDTDSSGTVGEMRALPAARRLSSDGAPMVRALPPAAAKKKSSLRYLMATLLVLLLVGGSAGGVYFWRIRSESDTTRTPPPVANMVQPDAKKPQSVPAPKGSSTDSVPAPVNKANAPNKRLVEKVAPEPVPPIVKKTLPPGPATKNVPDVEQPVPTNKQPLPTNKQPLPDAVVTPKPAPDAVVPPKPVQVQLKPKPLVLSPPIAPIGPRRGKPARVPKRFLPPGPQRPIPVPSKKKRRRRRIGTVRHSPPQTGGNTKFQNVCAPLCAKVVACYLKMGFITPLGKLRAHRNCSSTCMSHTAKAGALARYKSTLNKMCRRHGFVFK